MGSFIYDKWWGRFWEEIVLCGVKYKLFFSCFFLMIKVKKEENSTKELTNQKSYNSIPHYGEREIVPHLMNGYFKMANILHHIVSDTSLLFCV